MKSPGSSSSNSSGSKARKKHKKLDAICEKAYNRKRGRVDEELDEGNDNGGDELEIRRSTRVRKATVFLDVSPSPVKKRRKIDRGSLSGKREKGNTPSKRGDEEDEGDEETNWKCRLRSRSKNVGSGRKGGKEDSESPRGKKKLFEDFDMDRDGFKLVEGGFGGDDDEEFEGETSTIVKSKRPGRIKVSKLPLDEEEENDLNNAKEIDDDRNEMEVLGNDEDDNEGVEDDLLDLNGGIECGNEGLVEKVVNEKPNDLEKEEEDIGKVNEEVDEQNGDLQEQVECLKQGGDNVELDGIGTGNLEGGCHGDEPMEVQNGDLQEQVECLKQGGDHGDNVELDGIGTGNLEGGCHGDEPMEAQNANNVNKQNDIIAKRRIKEGRRCGLCGGATDGKPPKRLAYDMAESENDVCSGSSASEEASYDIWDGFGEEPGWLGRLLGPIMDRFGITGTWVHQHCAVWSPEVYFAGLGRLKNVRAALFRGRALKCSRCGRRGATLGCRVDRCPKTYHLPCARADGSIFNHRKFLIACSHHRHLFQPHGDEYVNKMKTKKLKLEIKKTSNDAWKKDIEAEEKWLEGEDEEFLKRERKRLHRDILRIAPVYIGGSNSEGGQSFEGWESVAGLQDVIRCMKEVVILPLLYPEFFTNMGLTPPRGVLLHGHPGTGKTLVVRSLIGSCAHGDKRIAYFARKGADCLGKYVGDAERQLRLLFQVAEKCQPSIIFFDEIDGLAPRRTRNQDQTHSSVVSTLLALLDGLKSRGSVVVIGATNRPDAVDPALRRPGRFDREIYFPLPSEKDRAEILALHTRKWPKPVSGSLLNWAARKTAGFAGADLQALCTQAAIIALKRNCPLQKILSEAVEKASDGHRVPLPAFAVEERDWLEALSYAPPPCSHREAGMAINDVTSSPLPAHLISCLLEPLTSLLVSLFIDERLWLPPPLSKAAKMVKNVIVSALNKKNMNSDSWWAHVKNLLQEADIAKEMEREFLRGGVLIKDSTFAGSGMLNDDDGKMHDAYHSSLLRNTSYASGKNSGLRILVAGGPRSGQGHLASCLVHCFVGNIKIQKVDMATISQEGRGDVLQGLTQILMKCSGLASCVIFMPRIDFWAINQDDEEKNDPSSIDDQTSESKSSSENDEDDVKTASDAWSSVMEQVDSICVSTSLMILATSEVSFQQLPISIRKFFNRDISKCTDSTPEYTVPRFSLQTDGNFNQDVVIISSAAKLSNDVVQQFLQLIHHGTHITTRVEEYKKRTAFGNDPDVASKLPEDPLVKVPLPNNSRQVKVKSSLTMAISSIGSQILGYPHFAELCWVTSKLKGGPYSDINGPWKGWPFNTCIIRSNNSLEKVAVISGSSNVASKGKSGVVRGLVAVGLSAYRGVYTSLREVSGEIKKVLTLLVENINAKIHAGKDRYRYACILSQVAYLEDVVNSWAYTLQSLEQDAHLMLQNLLPDTLPSPENPDQCANQFFAEECKLGDSNRNSQGIEILDKNPHKNAVRNNICIDLNNESGGSPQQVILEHSDLNAHLQTSVSADDLDGNNNILNGNIETDVVPESTGNHRMENGVGSLKNSNEFASTEFKSNDQVGFSEENISPICLYCCCVECLHRLHGLMRKLLSHEWEQQGICKRVEDIHDLVASFSMNLLLALRKEYAAVKQAKYENHGKLFDLQEKRACQCENSENKLVIPMNCSCHSMDERDHNLNNPPTPHLGLDTKFIYRDGVLIPVDLENDVPFHCKFETLCLCSLIEWIAMTKSKSLD